MVVNGLFSPYVRTSTGPKAQVYKGSLQIVKLEVCNELTSIRGLQVVAKKCASSSQWTALQIACKLFKWKFT